MFTLLGPPTFSGKIMAANFRTCWDAEQLQSELEKTRRMLETRGALGGKDQAGDTAGP